MPTSLPAQNKETLAREVWNLRSFLLLALAFLNVFLMLWIVPKFQMIFADALPGKPLPAITEFVVGCHVFVAAANVVFLVLCLVLTGRGWRWAKSLAWFLVLASFLEIGVTILALFLPMTSGVVIGMSDAVSR